MNSARVEIGAAVRFGWKTAKQYSGLVMGLATLALVVPLVPSLIADEFGKAGGTFAFVSLVFGLLSFALNIIVSLGLFRIGLKFVAGDKPQVSDLFGSYALFFRYLGATIIFALAVMAGFVLLVVPGIIIALRYGQYPYFMVDQNLGPIAALKASARVTAGAKGQLFLFYLTVVGINLLGVIALFVGYLFTWPMTLISSAFVYRALVSTAVLPSTPDVPVPQAPSLVPPAGV